MIDMSPIIINNEIIGFRYELIHVFNMDSGSGKTKAIVDSIYDIKFSTTTSENFKAICVNVKRNKLLSRRLNFPLFDRFEEFGSDDIMYLVGQKINILYVDEWFDLSKEQRDWILDWCIQTNTCLNAYGTS